MMTPTRKSAATWFRKQLKIKGSTVHLDPNVFGSYYKLQLRQGDLYLFMA